MSSKRPAMDGFIPRKPQNNNLDAETNNKGHYGSLNSMPKKSTVNYFDSPAESKAKINHDGGLFGNLSDADDWFIEPTDKKYHKKRRDKKSLTQKPKHLFRHIVKLLIILSVLALIGAGGYVVYRFISASGSIFQGSVIDIFKNQPLQEDSNGRSNFVIIGTSEDDPGHEGADLTDSIMIASLDQDTKDVFLFSIPRDLEVEYGMACIPGYRGKINAFYSCVNDGLTQQDEQERLTAVRGLVGEVLGMEIQYAVHVNYTVLTDVIDAIGGSITIDIESDDPRGYLDSQLDYQCGQTYAQRIANCPPSGHYIDLPNGVTTLTSKQALNLARARGDSAPTYGFANSNFEREKNQRKIIMAIREKALDTGTLTNISAILNLVDALGDNLRTNIQSVEINTLVDLASKVDPSNIFSLDLLGDQVLNGTGNPTAGYYDFSGIQEYLAQKLSSDPVVRESASIVVLNGTSQIGLGQQKADALEELGYNIYYVDNAPDEVYEKTQLYVVGENCDKTASALEALYGIAREVDEAPIATDESAQIILVIGDDQISQETQ